MAVIRQKKKNIIMAATVGLAVGIIPMGIVTSVMSAKYISVSKEFDEVKESYKEYTAYVMKGEKSGGDIVEDSDIEKIIFYSKEMLTDTQDINIAGKVLRQEVQKGEMLIPAMVYEDSGIEDDLRMYMFDYIMVPDGVKNGDIFDIRISFPNGEDYIVARGKTIVSRNETGVFINATERELLMISSAYVDTTIYEGAKIYASMYVTDYQQLSTVNYPVNMYVTKLADWNPNLIKEVEESYDSEKRQILEGNLYEFMGVSMESNGLE